MKIIKKILILTIYLSFVNQQKVKNGVYNIITNNLYLKSGERNIYLSDKFNINTFFRIRKISRFSNDTLYKIEKTDSYYRLLYVKDNELIFDKFRTFFDLWYIYKVSSENYIFKNINNCYIIIIYFHIFCKYIPELQASKFKLIKIYNEVNEVNRKVKYNNINDEILEKSL